MKELDLPYLHCKIEDDIVIGTYKSSIDLKIAKEVVLKRKEFLAGKSYPALIKGYQVSKISKEARDYFSSDEASEGILAAAMLTDSAFKVTLINFFLKVAQPKLPVRLFSDTDKAKKWLHQYVERKEEVEVAYG